MNLIPALHAFLEERHVTRAAERIRVSQPAASTMLARLRRHYNDELMTRTGNHYELTPLGAMLAKQTGSLMELSERLFATKSRFDPANIDREFLIAMSDYALAILGPPLLDAFALHAPHARLRFRDLGRTNHDDEVSARAVDGLVMPRGGHLRRLPHHELYRDEWICLVDADNHTAGDIPTIDELSTLPWISGYVDPDTGSPTLQRLESQGAQLNHQAAIESFHLIPHFIAGSQRVALLQRRLAEKLAPNSRLRILPCPFDLDPVIEAFWWHPAHADDAGHTWLRNLIFETAAATVAGPIVAPQ